MLCAKQVRNPLIFGDFHGGDFHLDFLAIFAKFISSKYNMLA
jgi:hypothetical protein